MTDLRHLGGRLARAAARRWGRLPRQEVGWRQLDAELDRWRGRPATFWWRDDDAALPDPQLERLLRLRDRLGHPLGLAVTPVLAGPALTDAVTSDGVRVLVHGWNHANNAPPGRPMAELSSNRSRKEVAGQLREGLQRLMQLFAGRVLPVMAPPFGALAPGLAGCLRLAGFSHVSLEQDFAGLAIRTVNAHCSVIDWKNECTATPDFVIRDLLIALRLRRFGLVARDRPIGVLTHHLVHDEAAWGLTETVLARLSAHPGVVFPPVPALFDL